VGLQVNGGCDDNWLTFLIGFSLGALLIDLTTIAGYICKSYSILMATYLTEMVICLLYFILSLVILVKCEDNTEKKVQGLMLLGTSVLYFGTHYVLHR